MAILRLQSPSLCSEAVRILREEVEAAQEDERVHSMAIRPAAPCIAGSDVAALHADIAESRSDHYDSIAHLCRALAESSVPVVAMLDGNLHGPALGLAAHAHYSVVTDRTRLLLAGPEYGFVPESFATYQLARLPAGLGAYLALTGAALSGAELRQLGLATHYTEAQALNRLEVELGLQPQRCSRQLGGILDDVCLDPPTVPLEADSALYFAEEIATCFGEAQTLEQMVAALEAGGSPWHAQVLDRLRASSPLALSLSLSLIKHAEASDHWADCLAREAAVSAAALAASDCATGLAHLAELKAEIIGEAEEMAAGEGRFGDLRWHEEHEMRSPTSAPTRAAAAADGGKTRTGPPAGWAGGGAGGAAASGDRPAWEHASIEAVADADLAPYLS